MSAVGRREAASTLGSGALAASNLAAASGLVRNQRFVPSVCGGEQGPFSRK